MFPTQKICADNIYNKFKTTDYCLFVAQMQSGKTGTYIQVAQQMLSNNIVSKVVVFSGNREKELRIQTQNRIQSDIIHPHSVVVWGTSLHHFVPPKQVTLYIWDESHFGQSKGQAVDKFLQKCNLKPGIQGQNGNFFLSVSATPFSELHNIHKDNVVWMTQDINYWGVENMLLHQILPYDDILDIPHILKPYSSGYSLIRLYDNDNINAILRIIGLPHILYDSNFHEDIETILSNEPLSHTIIILKGKLQMGKTILNQQYINLCIETCTTKKTDSLLQGFIGRFCGFNTNHLTKIFIPSNIFYSGEIETYIQMFHGGDIPKKGMNLLLRTNTSKKEVFYHA
jgi:hypothetical protein